jgi:hypothetical protein
MSIHWWPVRGEFDDGRKTKGRSIYIEMFGFSLEIVVMRA